MTLAKLGKMKFFNVKESLNHSVDVTEYAVEKGTPFSDHVRQTNPTFAISGYIMSDNWNTELRRLVNSMNSGTILKYVGKFSVTDVVIESIKPSADSKIANGIEVSLTLRKIRLTKTPYVKAKKKIVPIRKPVTNSGERKQVGPRVEEEKKYHTVVKGDTYWYCSQKYGVSVDWLTKNNPWDARKIPVGAKMRVG